MKNSTITPRLVAMACAFLALGDFVTGVALRKPFGISSCIVENCTGFTSTNSYCTCPYTLKKNEDCEMVKKSKKKYLADAEEHTLNLQMLLWNNLDDGVRLCEDPAEGREVCFGYRELIDIGKGVTRGRYNFCKGWDPVKELKGGK
ncbi:hypothetical protein BJ508DRAFT_149933 [Ascobolus immersus RN42]|uniref:Extracellular membrane protein CFEM domain-containing protein n=1 Tax=Ascobolus immersus RN42 TaxID=1160509 RepID=A0A3N4HYR6_ASCIM|nr:hypothetical protein BJ508DRAFT_149933 [Ascobolus immersus RN42]